MSGTYRVAATLAVAGTLAAFTLTHAVAQPAANTPSNPPPPAANQNAANQNDAPPELDQYCRHRAADQSGYRPGSSGSAQAYGSAYYACMDSAANMPPPPPGYYGAPYPYPYPYPYYGPYYGPAFGFRFGFGGWHGRWR
jgi:hypothetical protein